MRIVAITACPTGIAHTYMAAEALTEAARERGHEIAIETQGSAGSDKLDPSTIAGADAVVFAADVEVSGRERFAGKPLVETSVKRAINHANDLIDEAETAAASAPAAAPGAAGAPPPPAPATRGAEGAGFGTRLRQWLMTGVSYMIPFVAAGGILIALAFLFGGPEVVFKLNGGTFEGRTYEAVADFTKILSQAGFPALLLYIGGIAFSMLVPILSGFIAYGMADRPGLTPGVVTGLIAVAVGAGFLGGLVGGLLAGAIVMWIKRVNVPRAVQGIMPVVVIPLVATFLAGFIMLIVIGRPIAAAQTGLNNWLNGLSGSNAVLLGILLGLMMAFDLGGPVNKAAYTFALASLASGNLEIMAAVMAAGMTPPIGLALATVLRPKLFNEPERAAGEAAWLLGASFITEGAIPFAAADPLRVIPACMVGSAVTGGLSMLFGCTSRAPHGGIWVIGLVGRPLLYLVAIAAGVVVTAFGVSFAKQLGRSPQESDAALEAA